MFAVFKTQWKRYYIMLRHSSSFVFLFFFPLMKLALWDPTSDSLCFLLFLRLSAESTKLPACFSSVGAHQSSGGDPSRDLVPWERAHGGDRRTRGHGHPTPAGTMHTCAFLDMNLKYYVHFGCLFGRFLSEWNGFTPLKTIYTSKHSCNFQAISCLVFNL